MGNEASPYVLSATHARSPTMMKGERYLVRTRRVRCMRGDVVCPSRRIRVGGGLAEHGTDYALTLNE